MEPAVASEKLVCILARSQKRYQTLKLRRIFRTDIGSLTIQVLRVRYSANFAIDGLIAETGIDNDWPYLFTSRFKKKVATIGHVSHVLHRRYVLGVFLQIKKLRQLKVRGKSGVIDWCVHGSAC